MVKSWLCQAICVVAAALGVGPAMAMRSLDTSTASSSITPDDFRGAIAPSHQGPYDFKTFQYQLVVPGDLSKGSKLEKLALTLTYPASRQGSTQASASSSSKAETWENAARDGIPIKPFALIVLFNGFLIPSFWYRVYAHTLASWGYVVLQYDAQSVGLVTDCTELSFFPHLLRWAYNMSLPGGCLAGLIDSGSLAVMGHSRGAKLAALHYAAGMGSRSAPLGSNSISTGAAHVKLAILVDPVDSQNPSAISELTSCDDPQLVVIGAGIKGNCNPINVGSAAFRAVMGPSGKWLNMPDVGHMQYTIASNKLEEQAFNWLCGAGSASNQAVINATMTFVLPALQEVFQK